MKNKEDYFEYSKAHGVPMRCPLLGRCERRAHTLAVTHDWDFNRSVELAGLTSPIVGSIGDSAYKTRGANNYIIGGLCPEVSLFDDSVPVPRYQGVPVRRAQYDMYMNPQYELLETSHFLQCAEYVASEKGAVITQTTSTSDLIKYLKENHQWIIGTVIAALAVTAAFLVP